jgi:hypothetical protein
MEQFTTERSVVADVIDQLWCLWEPQLYFMPIMRQLHEHTSLCLLFQDFS